MTDRNDDYRPGNPAAKPAPRGGRQGLERDFGTRFEPDFEEARRGRQSYSGMGPKNYKRSDERITEDLCERLTDDHDIDASDVEVRVFEGTATLEGTVPQRWMKHRAEDLADGCAGVRAVENRIKVQSAGSYSGPSTQRDISGGTDTHASQDRQPHGTAH